MSAIFQISKAMLSQAASNLGPSQAWYNLVSRVLSMVSSVFGCINCCSANILVTTISNNHHPCLQRSVLPGCYICHPAILDQEDRTSIVATLARHTCGDIISQVPRFFKRSPKDNMLLLLKDNNPAGSFESEAVENIVTSRLVSASMSENLQIQRQGVSGRRPHEHT